MAKSQGAKSNERSKTDSTAAKSAPKGASAEMTGHGSAASVADQAAEALGQAQGQASSIVSKASEQAASQLGMQKDRAATTLGAVATALHEAGRQMQQQDETAIAGYIESAAGQVDHFSTMLREQDINQIVNTTAQFARRQPALFLAGAFALGFLGTRFLKSSSPSRGQSFGDAGYATSGGWDRAYSDRYASGSSSAGYAAPSRFGSSGFSGTAGSGGYVGASSGGFGARAGSSGGSGTGSSSGFGAGSAPGSSGAMGSRDSFETGSGMTSSGATSSARQEGASGTTGERSERDWSSRDSASLG